MEAPRERVREKLDRLALAGKSITLPAGTKLGPHEVLGVPGTDVMGEVFRARDPRLSREVAIKLLPAPFEHDAERLARFEREARLLASFSHPHIAAIHGLEQAILGRPRP